MNLDVTFKRFFPAVICALIALAAYFQASGISEMVASSIGDAPAAKPRRVATPTIRHEPPSADPILQRNPFDSVTGPLDGVATAPSFDHDAGVSGEGEPQDADPSCSFGRVVLIMAADDPAWSFASIEGADGKKLRRIGDQVDDHIVEAMAWDRVWLVKDATRCKLSVTDKRAATPAPRKAKGKKRRKKSRRGAKLSADLASKIHKISDTQFNIERSVVDEILEKQAELMRFTRMRPVKDGDKVVGLRMSRIRSGTLLDVLGLKNGDQIQSINGFELTDPQKALEAYGRLRTADALKLTITRGGQVQNIDYNIQ